MNYLWNITLTNVIMKMKKGINMPDWDCQLIGNILQESVCEKDLRVDILPTLLQ